MIHCISDDDHNREKRQKGKKETKEMKRTHLGQTER
jgi:hypothetical protein